MDAAGKPMTVRAFIICPENESALRVGGLGLVERWQKSLAAHGVPEVLSVQRAELPSRLSQASGPVVLSWGDWVAEHLALEAFVEDAGTVEAGALRTLTVEGKEEPFPVVVLGADLAARAASLGEGAFADAATFVGALRNAANPTLEPKTVY
jgi:hypothetical protein